MISFMLVAGIFSNRKCAGNHHARTLSTIMAALSLLIFLGACSLKCHKISKQMQHVCDDLGALFKPLSLLIVVFLILQGVLEETSADWGNLVMLASCITLGIAFAMSGVVKDIVGYIFIRMNDYFSEGEFIYFKGDLYRVRRIFWCYTETYCTKTRSITFIPNSEIATNAVNNQSRDDSRVTQIELPLPSDIKAAALKSIVADAWKVLQSVEETGFTGANGKQYASQFVVNKSLIWISSVQLNGVTDSASFNLQLKLFGKYHFSKPPKWTKEEPEPPMDKRQLEWQPLWNFQVEWFLLEVKTLIENNSKS
jgi:small-conductance mechanosensitive channel